MRIISVKNLIAIFVVMSIATFVFLGCKKTNTDCTAVIMVKSLTDTNVTVAYADVIIAPDYPDVRVEGKSDATGQFQTVFKYEGILDIIAIKITPGTPPDTIRGKTVIRLKPGETVTKTVFVD